MWLQITQTIFTFFLNFVQFYQYKQNLRNAYIPYMHLIFTFATFVVVPVVAILIFIYVLIADNIWGTCYGTWLLTYSLSCICLTPWAILIIYPTFMAMKEQYEDWMEQDA